MTDPIVTVSHMRDAQIKFCVAGARRWFEHYGLDFRAFLNNGLPASAIEATGDALGAKLAAFVRAKHEA